MCIYMNIHKYGRHAFINAMLLFFVLSCSYDPLIVLSCGYLNHILQGCRRVYGVSEVIVTNVSKIGRYKKLCETCSYVLRYNMHQIILWTHPFCVICTFVCTFANNINLNNLHVTIAVNSALYSTFLQADITQNIKAPEYWPFVMIIPRDSNGENIYISWRPHVLFTWRCYLIRFITILESGLVLVSWCTVSYVGRQWRIDAILYCIIRCKK